MKTINDVCTKMFCWVGGAGLICFFVALCLQMPHSTTGALIASAVGLSVWVLGICFVFGFEVIAMWGQRRSHDS